jgi:hypothetical protein
MAALRAREGFPCARLCFGCTELSPQYRMQYLKALLVHAQIRAYGCCTMLRHNSTYTAWQKFWSMP